MTKANETIEMTCPVCGTKYPVNPTRLKHGRGLTCSRICSYKARFETIKNKRTGSVCLNCGKTISTVPSRVQHKAGAGKYCSRKCRDAHWINKNHPGYIGSPHTHKYGKQWRSIRRAILKRDFNSCQRCGVSKPRLHIHHIRPFRLFDNSADANQPTNLITLCPSCHRTVEANPEALYVQL